MPIYEYAPTSGHCDKCQGRFEVMQRIADAKLAACPTCGQPCERRISAVALGGTYSVSDDKIKNSGLTKYKKAGDGVYERTAGTGGPEVIVRK
jgi:putative FmdB family regulatory protein